MLIAPLDWGYGHLTRSMALARRMTNKGSMVVWCVTQEQATLILGEFPEAEIEIIPGYELKFSGTGNFWKEAWKNRRALSKGLKADHRTASELADRCQADMIISDCRFGFHANRSTSVLLNHQRSPVAGALTLLAQLRMRGWEKHFDELWVPDSEDSLAGQLATGPVHVPVRLIGPLSRLDPGVPAQASDVLIIASGPEAYRKAYVELCLDSLRGMDLDIHVVGHFTNDARCTPFAGGEELSGLVGGAKVIMARSGYSSLMDLRHMGRQAILTPTPGQHEQQYLASWMRGHGWSVASDTGALSESVLQGLQKAKKAEATS